MKNTTDTIQNLLLTFEDMDTKDINNAITELTSLYDNINKSWQDDKCLTDTYQVFRQEDYKESYNKLENTNIENIILGILSNSLNEKILIRLRTLLEENAHIYTTRQDEFTSIDFHKIYSLYEKHLFDNKFALLQKDKEDIQSFTYPTEQEKEILLKENQQEKNQLENERGDYLRSNTWMLENYYTKIFDITQSFLSIINSYFTDEKEEKFIPTEENNSEQTKDIAEKQTIQIEPDTIFRTNMFDKLLSLEKKLITDKYLDENLNWIAKHDNGTIDKKTLVAFLVGLVESRYFLPNKDSKIKSFFESRYNIEIGQNFERSRRTPLIDKYSSIFYDYPF